MNYFIAVNRTELKDLIDELGTIYEATEMLALDKEFEENVSYKFYNDKPLEITVDYNKK